MDIREIQQLIKFVAKSGASEVKLETDDIKITIKTGGTYVPEAEVVTYTQSPVQMIQAAPAAPVSTPAAPAAAPAEDAKYVTIKSPMIGTFYRKSSPDKPNLVDVGSEIKPGSPLCVVEAMKLFNEIEAEISGKIVKVLVDDASPVEFDQPLFLVDPA
ncbi:MAG: acetyl-CoA carboxylase biotin carboxyl carrier protein [Flavobacteriaceae bacterium]|jgi:acetyl-CoA carboxylase biotin carboxyl carrier protein|nr:acetyl-CoA carboxylase biotin carboxyl carrier protein [Flavobacteriaceae bacterium]MDP4674415.1 acetyl-CoA carboxylase biotin carboxyl carrier protein [Flavobacteriaceae bacterium]MDP4754308.1 acetyl-CoA carboxylase biotin carboxyl carrier protein [Flavobacteriaceae bacterium]MDP4794286.1 acetyl-CoA carboxylase biotin carboxyl carrier protein [Flavobacteriaceae bacterium]MDP4885754.1 acetyl-CoA carboxylase biotin carboxyl carrier protein [Flavobacteriaceae bacterium]